MGTVCKSEEKMQIRQPGYSAVRYKDQRKITSDCFIKKEEIVQEPSYIDEVQIDSIKLYKVQQREMTEKLHKNVVAIIWKQKQAHFDQVGRGSGLLISKNLVLTSAHNFYYKKERVSDTSFDIYPGQYGSLGRSYKIERVFIPPQFHHTKTAKFDFALVKLKEKVNNYDFISLKSEVSKQGQTLSIFGYPSSKYENTSKQENIEAVVQWGLIKKDGIAEIQQNGYEILHKVSTQPGQSGSAIIQINGKQMYVIGIHKGGKSIMINGEKTVLNSGIRLTKNVIELLRSSAIQMRAEMFEEAGDQKQTNENDKESCQSLLIKGRQQYMVGKYQQSVESFKKVVRSDDQNDLAYFLLGNSYIKLSNIHEAIVSFQKAIQINPKDSEAYYNLGNAYLEIQDIESSISNYKKAIKVNQNNFEAHYNLGKVYETLNKLLQAIQHFSNAVKIKNNDFQAWISLGNTYKKAKQYQKAIESYIRATIIKPDSPEAFNSLGSTYQDTKQYNLAIECFKTAIKLKKDYQTAYYNLAIALEGLSRMQEAINAYKKAIEINPKYHIAYNNLGLAYFNSGQKQEAIKCFRRTIEIKADYGPAYYNLGEALQKTNNSKEALVYYQKYAQLNPEDVDAIHKILELKTKI